MTILVFVFTSFLPYTPLAVPFDFAPLSATGVSLILAITAAYVVATELVKRRFFHRHGRRERHLENGRGGAKIV